MKRYLVPNLVRRNSAVAYTLNALRKSFSLLALPVFGLALAGNAQAANTATLVNKNVTDLTASGTATYSVSITPTAAQLYDIQFTSANSYSTSFFTDNGTALVYGTLNDIDANQPIYVTDNSATASSITLSTASNETTGSNASDLLYVASGNYMTIQSGAGVLTLKLAASGNIDTAGILNLAGPVSIGTGLTTTFTGAGTTSITGNIANTTGAITVNSTSGSLYLSGSNAYTGATTITSGNLIANSSTAFATGGVGTSAISVASGGALDYAATSNAQLTTAAATTLSLASGSTFGGSIGSTTTNAEVVVGGAASATGTVKVNIYGISGDTPATGTYTLLAGNGSSTLGSATYSTGLVYNASNFTVATPTVTGGAHGCCYCANGADHGILGGWLDGRHHGVECVQR